MLIYKTRWVRIRDLPGMSSETAIECVCERLRVGHSDADLAIVSHSRFLDAVRAVQGESSADGLRALLAENDYPDIAIEY